MGKNDIYKMKENAILYSFQGVACILVILIHEPFPSLMGIFFSSLARVAVPLFFMIGGFSLFSCVETSEYKNKVKDRLIRNAKLTLSAMAIYFLLDIIKQIIQRESILEFILPIFKLENILKLVLFGIMPPGSGGVLWFMIAMVFIYAFRYIVQFKKRTIYRNAIISIIIMVLLNLLKVVSTSNQWIIGSFNLSESWIYGNWLAIGIPSFNIGIGVAKYINEHKISKKNISIGYSVMLACAILNFFTAYILDVKYEMYLSYTLWTLVIDVFIFIVSSVTETSKSNLLSIIGKKYSKDIYLWHPIIISFINIVYKILHFQGKIPFDYIKPILVILFSVALSVIICFFRTKIIRKRV